jgi:adenosylhomocysteine nucleosidase
MSKAFLIAIPAEVKGINNLLGCPVHYSGVGKVNAAIGAMELIQKGYTELINIGSCGSTQHPVGSIIQIGKSFQDIDCAPICEYGYTAFESATLPYIELDAQVTNSCFSTDYFYHQEYKDKYSPHYLAQINTCSVFDMELFAIAKACSKFNIKLSAYKWVSDDGDFSQWEKNCELAFHRVEELLRNK